MPLLISRSNWSHLKINHNHLSPNSFQNVMIWGPFVSNREPTHWNRLGKIDNYVIQISAETVSLSAITAELELLKKLFTIEVISKSNSFQFPGLLARHAAMMTIVIQYGYGSAVIAAKLNKLASACD